MLRWIKLQEEIETGGQFQHCQIFYELNEPDFAYDYFLKVSDEVNSTEGAESKYRVIEILFDRDAIDQLRRRSTVLSK